MRQGSRILERVKSHSTLVWLLVILLVLLVDLLVVFSRLSLPILALMAAAVAILFRLFQYVRIPLLRIEKLCCYLTVITGFFGVAVFPIDIGPFTIFPYRIFLVLMWGLFAARLLIQGKVMLSLGQVKPYMAFFGIWMAYAMISLNWAADKGDLKQVLSQLYENYKAYGYVPYTGREEYIVRFSYREMARRFAELLDSLMRTKTTSQEL